jgi:hypothetical protein
MPKKVATTIPVNRRSLVARIQRALAKEGRQLRTDRRGRQTVFVVIDMKKFIVAENTVDLEELGHRLGALRPWEKLAG